MNKHEIQLRHDLYMLEQNVRKQRTAFGESAQILSSQLTILARNRIQLDDTRQQLITLEQVTTQHNETVAHLEKQLAEAKESREETSKLRLELVNKRAALMKQVKTNIEDMR